MKFAKKIFVGLMVVAMLVSCFAFAASAEAPERPVEKFESVLEYIGKDTYLVEDYESQEGSEYVFVPSHFYTDEEAGEVPYFEFVESDKATTAVVSESGKKYLSITNENSDKVVGYKMLAGSDGYGYLVASFDFKTGDVGGTNGADVFVKATLGDYFDDVTLFAANTSDDSNMEFLYSEYDSDRIVYSTVKATAVPELGVWYHVDVCFSPEGETYWVEVTKGEEVVLSFEDTIYDSAAGIDSVRIYVSDSADAGVTKTSIDNLAAYEGTAVRDVINSKATLADLAVKIDAYARHEATPVAEKVEVADFYADFYGDSDNSYVAPDDIANKAELDAIRANAESFRNQAYLLALETYTKETNSIEGYYAKTEHLSEKVARFYDLFEGKDSSSFVGLEAADIEKVLATYGEVVGDLEETRLYSEAFVRAVEVGYDAKNKDFGYMQLKYASLSTLVDEIELDYKYSDVKADTKYPTVADAKAEYDALEAKILAIVKNASEVFIPAVEKMDKTQVESVSKESPYITANFEALYQNYLTASSVYSNGTVHEALDPATYPGLTEVIAEYLEYEAYVQERIAECNAFVQAIRGAENSTYYKTLVEQLDKAALYLDGNKEQSLDKYTGVEAAVALYDSLVEKLGNSKKAADAYIAAVNAIDVNASYATLKSAVDAARVLKADSSLVGYAGIAEADAKFAEADAKLSVLQGHSSTLLYAIEALKTADTLAERRELIFIALNAKDGAEENITGVTAAKAELENYIKKYNEDVARVNALFAGVVDSVASSISSFAPTDGVIISAEVVEALLK